MVSLAFRRRIGAALAVSTGVLVVSAILAISLGSVDVSFKDTVKIILYKIGRIDRGDWSAGTETIIHFVRVPRVLIAGEVGMALGISGAVMQGVFRNPMADPGIIGVSAGASLGAVTAIYTGFASLHLFATPFAAFVGALVATTLIRLVSTVEGRASVSTLLLAGVAASALFSAATSTILSFSNDYQMRQMVFWMMGGLSGRGYEHVYMITAPVLLGSAAMLVFARDLNVMLLGEEGARGVGVDPEVSNKILLTLASLVTGAAVSVTGTIGFVGLIVPHILRLIVGPDHRVLLPVSALGGASFLILADLIARVVARPIELQVGIVTAFIGAPYFIYLLRRSQRQRGMI